MNIYLASLTILVSCTLFSSAHAGLYKGLDEEGNVTYSDRPFENSEKIKPPPISVMDAPKVPKSTPAVDATSDDTAETSYKSFSIAAPKNGQTIWNVPDLTVSIKMTPSLNTKQGHYIRLLMDGKTLVKKSSSMLMQIGRADRGEHKLQAQLRNKKGKVLKRSKTITVHIKNTVVPRGAR